MWREKRKFLCVHYTTPPCGISFLSILNSRFGFAAYAVESSNKTETVKNFNLNIKNPIADFFCKVING